MRPDRTAESLRSEEVTVNVYPSQETRQHLMNSDVSDLPPTGERLWFAVVHGREPDLINTETGVTPPV